MRINNKTFDRLLFFSLFFMAAWFFGNLYEEVVLVPNHVNNSYSKLQLWHQYFTVVNQVYFYVPFTQIAVAAIIVLFFKSKHKTEKELLKKASISGILAIVLTIIIITQLNTILYFGDNLARYKETLHKLSVVWLWANATRMILVGIALYFIFKTYMMRQRMVVKKL